MSNKLLVTYFGPFNHFLENPAELIANKLKLIFQNNTLVKFHKLEVSFACIDQFLKINWDEYNTIIELGVATKSDRIRLEINGTNFVTGIDSKGVNKVGRILENESELSKSSFGEMTLTQLRNDFPKDVVISKSAGKFLCNYLYYKSLVKFPEKEILFIHLANFLDIEEALSIEKQVEIIRSFIEKSGENT